MKRCFGIFLFLLFSVYCQAQNDSTFSFHGRVVERGTFQPIAFATILVTNKNQGIASKTDGSFSFPVNIGDEIRITSVGYEPWFYTITEVDRTDKRAYTVQMDQKVYELEEIEITELSDNFYLKRPKRDTLKIYNPFLNTVNPTDWSVPQMVPLTNGQAGFAISGLLNTLTKEYKQEKILKERKAAKEFISKRELEREKHFNKDLVRRITRIDERVIDEFMDYCAFLDGEIIGRSEYEITIKVLRKYDSFLRR